jgi:hypothetical protein
MRIVGTRHKDVSNLCILYKFVKHLLNLADPRTSASLMSTLQFTSRNVFTAHDSE